MEIFSRRLRENLFFSYQPASTVAAGVEKVKAEKQTQPGLEVMEAHLNGIIMEVSSQQKMPYFKRRLGIYVPVRFGNPASRGKLAA